MTASPVSLAKVKSGARSPSRKSAKASSSTRRAVGIVRVSRVGSRSGETFVSPGEQKRRIEDACSREGFKLIETFEELDVSGGAPLAKRPGLRQAVEMVENGQADVIVAAFLDRLIRSVTVQAELAQRIEKAGGRILAVDVGDLTGGTSSQWLSASLLGHVAEYQRRVTAERTQGAKERAIARGVPTFAKIPPGYSRRDDGTIAPNRDAATVKAAFKRRANGATVMDVRDYLWERGIERSFHGVTALLASRIYLGELRFGDLLNEQSHKPIVDEQTWHAVQKMRSPRGRRPKSERLLARLGVLRCGTCGARLVVGSTRQGAKAYSFYRCNPTSDCPQRVTISADLAESCVVEDVRRLIAGMQGKAAGDDIAAEAERAYQAAEDALTAAVEAFDGLGDLPAARQRLLALREARDEARDRLEMLTAGQTPAIKLGADDWDNLTLEEQRALIQAVEHTWSVMPGSGPDRIILSPL